MFLTCMNNLPFHCSCIIRSACSLLHLNEHICGDLICYPCFITLYGCLSLMLVTLKAKVRTVNNTGYHGLPHAHWHHWGFLCF